VPTFDHLRVIGHRDGRANHRKHLAHVARPGMMYEYLQYLLRYFDAARTAGFLCIQRFCQFDNVLAMAQWRQLQGQSVQSVVEVFAKFARLHKVGQPVMGRTHDGYVDFDRLAAHWRDYTILKNAQQSCLQRWRQLADLVENNVPPSAHWILLARRCASYP